MGGRKKTTLINTSEKRKKTSEVCHGKTEWGKDKHARPSQGKRGGSQLKRQNKLVEAKKKKFPGGRTVMGGKA